MATRIRYERIGNTLESVRKFKSSRGIHYDVIIDLTTMTYRIRNLTSDKTAKYGGKNINNLTVLKRSIKRALKKLGVEFELDIRNRE